MKTAFEAASLGWGVQMVGLTMRVIRLLDVVLSLAGLVLGAPVLLGLMSIGWIDNRSPLFLQKRIGRHHRPFTMVKFRTMRPGTPCVATHLASSDSITPFGRFLRRTKLDELPQLWNVLKGEMSLVGPRPCLPSQSVLIAEREQRGVFAARPGITGLAQVYEIDMSDPWLLAEVDAHMVNNLRVRDYFRYLFLTAVGHGFGDRIRRA